jgi:hypothetical protein
LVQEDLSVAYSPGVAEPCVAIQQNERWAYEYTAKGHLVGVITNGTAVLGLGERGAAAPPAEGPLATLTCQTVSPPAVPWPVWAAAAAACRRPARPPCLRAGNIGALAGKPVMEGKAVLFKKFADLDAFDIEVGAGQAPGLEGPGAGVCWSSPPPPSLAHPLPWRRAPAWVTQLPGA